MSIWLVLALLLCLPFFSSSKPHSLSRGSSLSVENKYDILISTNALFTAGFHRVGDNAYCFAIWFSDPLHDGTLTIVWMVNRDMPVNGKRSKLSLLKTGNLVLKDADELPVWTTGTSDSTRSMELHLNETGNLVLQKPDGEVLWQSFESPTDTLLPYQKLTKSSALVSSRSSTNQSSGFYKLYFDNDNVLHLVYISPNMTSTYWPNPELRAWDSNRYTYNNERTAAFNSTGHFHSTDNFDFYPADVGEGPQRKLTIDVDGNVRMYSLDRSKRSWQVTWQAISQSCSIHGICGANSTCSYDPKIGRKCSCLLNHKMINRADWSYGCEPEFKPTLCGHGEDVFIHFPHFDFYGYDTVYAPNSTLNECKQACLKICDCKGIQYKYDSSHGYHTCYAKNLLINGFHATNFNGSMYIKFPRSILSPYGRKPVQDVTDLYCSAQSNEQLDRSYEKKQENGVLKFMLWFAAACGVLEFTGFIFFFYRVRQTSGEAMQGHLHAATGFKRFSYAELKKASENFKNEIGRGGGGVVYKGTLSDNRVVAIKCLKKASYYQGEAEFLAEVSVIGKLNHMNLIQTLGYCAERKQRLLVYEFVEHGSLAQNLSTNTLDWEKRYEIAVGTAKGLAYLHEECLEWVLHCDVKPHNILLDSNYRPKVADFGLSKLLNRGGTGNSGFTRVRGTRGYMAPEWVFNLPITSKVDVYSYGVVILEMITGRSPISAAANNVNDEMEQTQLVNWVREKALREANEGGSVSWIKEIMDPKMEEDCDMDKMKALIEVALRCADEEREARPTMGQVVNMLLQRDNEK